MVIRNLDEIDEEGRWENDKDLVEHLINDVEVILATRIPETKADDRNRIMIVALGKQSIRGKVLRVANKLREKEEWKHTFISVDRTKRERQKHYQLRKELRKGGRRVKTLIHPKGPHCSVRVHQEA